MPIIFSGSRMQGGAGVSQMDPYASTFLSGFGQGLNLGAASVSRGADMAEQRRQDAQRQGEWDRQYGLQQQAFDYRTNQDATERADRQRGQQQAWAANAPLLAGLMGGREAPGGVGPPVPGAAPDLSGLDPQQQAGIVNQYQQAAVLRAQQQRQQAIQQGLQEMAPATMQLVDGMPPNSPMRQVYAQQLPMIQQMAQADPAGALESLQRLQQAAAVEIGKHQARQEALPGVKEYVSQFPLTPAERNAVVALVASGAIEPEDAGDQVKRMIEAKRQQGLTGADYRGVFPQLSADRAEVLAKFDAAGRHLDLPEVSINGQQKMPSLASDPVLKLLEVKMQNARAAASSLNDKGEAGKALAGLEKEYEDRLKELGSGKSSPPPAPSSPPDSTTPSPDEPTDAQIDEALRALGPSASDQQVLDWIRSRGGGSK